MTTSTQSDGVDRKDGKLVCVSTKMTPLEKGLLRACKEKSDETFLSGYLRGVLREHIREELGPGALDD